jgi:hypothetical protein
LKTGFGGDRQKRESTNSENRQHKNQPTWQQTKSASGKKGNNLRERSGPSSEIHSVLHKEQTQIHQNQNGKNKLHIIEAKTTSIENSTDLLRNT